MENLLSTNELLLLIEESRDSININSIKILDEEAKVIKIVKTIYWIVIAFLILHLLYLSLPFYLDAQTITTIKGTDAIAVVKKDQSPPILEITIVVIEDFDYDDLALGDYVVVHNPEDDINMEKRVVAIDFTNNTFEATYANQTIELYTSDDLIGIYKEDATFFQLFSYGMSTLRGFIGTIIVYIIIAGVSYYIIFIQHDQKNEDEDSDSYE
ncbi:hypothetical protein KHQ89_07980 [Mycoplasmatota bacterium]|nr:hypothetical protein KHQ89_07980 [Mycoplasmatota bacterium]